MATNQEVTVYVAKTAAAASLVELKIAQERLLAVTNPVSLPEDIRELATKIWDDMSEATEKLESMLSMLRHLLKEG